MPTCDQFTGCLLGLALGDALGAPYEGGPLERTLWKLIGRTSRGEIRWTDDTQMSLDLAESLIANDGLDLDDLAKRFADGYRWSRGYGPAAARQLKRIRRGMPWSIANRSVYRDGSFGNGGAMRAPVIALFFAGDTARLVDAARDSARVTHAHPLGIEGAVLIAAATAAALRSSNPIEILDAAAGHCELEPFHERLRLARAWIESPGEPSLVEVSRRLGRGIAAVDSCVTAVYVGVRFLGRTFIELQQFIARCGGDADTIGAMAGAIWGAVNGEARLPPVPLSRLEQVDRIWNVAEALFRVSEERNCSVGPIQ